MLDQIQRRATKIIPELRDLTYAEHLKERMWFNNHRDKEVFKILNGYENIDRKIVELENTS